MEDPEGCWGEPCGAVALRDRRRPPRYNAAVISSLRKISQQNPTVLGTLKPFCIQGSAVQQSGWWQCEQPLLSSLIILKRTILQKESEPPISSWKEELRYFSQLDALCFFVRVSTNVKYYEIPSNLQWWQGNTTTCLQKWSQWTQRAEFLISMTFTWDFNL